MSQSYLDQPNRNNLDWPEIRFPDRNAPLNRVYYDSVVLDNDEVKKWIAPLSKADADGYTVTANTAGALHGEFFTISDHDGGTWTVILDGNSSHNTIPTTAYQIIVRIAVGATAATVASEIAKRLQQYGGRWMAIASGSRLYIYTHKVVSAFAGVTITGWASFSAAETVNFFRPGLPPSCILGSRHPECDWLTLTDCWMSSSNDKRSTFSRVWQADILRLSQAYPSLDLNSILLGGGTRLTSFPYAHRDSPEIAWSFTIANPEGYVRAAQLTPMPGEPDALLISEQHQRDGQSVTVTRTYKRIAALSQQYKLSFVQDTETGDTGSKTVVWSYDTFAADFSPPAVGSACPIDNGGVADSLDFTGLVVIKAPTYTATTADLGRATVVYGKLTGTQLTGKAWDSPIALPPERFLTGKTIQNSSQIVPAGTSPDTSSTVITSVVTPQDAIRSLLNSSVLISYGQTPLYAWVVDQKTGKGSMVTEQVVPAGATGGDVDAAGNFSEVTPVNAYWSIKTTRKAATLVGYANAVPYEKTERTPILWPAVMTSYGYKSVMDSSESYYRRLLHYDMIAPYSGDVKVVYREWWQKTAPTAPTADEMIATPIKINGAWGNVSIDDCLHPEFIFEESALVRYQTGSTSNPWTTGARVLVHTVPATNLTEWPATVTKLDTDRNAGGYDCMERVVYRPVNYAIAQSTITYRNWAWEGTADADSIYYPG